MKPTNNQAGFSLIELLVVIAIIGVLAGTVMLSVSSARVKGRDAKRAGDIRQTITSLDQYYIQNGAYPTGTASLAGGGALLTDPDALNGGNEPFVPNYIGMLPQAPAPADGSCAGTGAGFNNYWYESVADGSSYTLTFCLGRDTQSWPAGTRYASPNGVQ